MFIEVTFLFCFGSHRRIGNCFNGQRIYTVENNSNWWPQHTVTLCMQYKNRAREMRETKTLLNFQSEMNLKRTSHEIVDYVAMGMHSNNGFSIRTVELSLEISLLLMLFRFCLPFRWRWNLFYVNGIYWPSNRHLFILFYFIFIFFFVKYISFVTASNGTGYCFCTLHRSLVWFGFLRFYFFVSGSIF